VYNFDYEQPYSGETTRHLARVVSVRKLTPEDIARITASSRYRTRDSEFIRTETMVTCLMPDGRYRSFYGERTTSCRKSFMGRFLFATGLARFFCR
jgi:hypothetical protein